MSYPPSNLTKKEKEKWNKKIPKGTIVRMMDDSLNKILKDTTVHGHVEMIRVDENYKEITGERKRTCILFLYKDDPGQSILYQPIPEEEIEEYKKRNNFTRFEIMEI